MTTTCTRPAPRTPCPRGQQPVTGRAQLWLPAQDHLDGETGMSPHTTEPEPHDPPTPTASAAVSFCHRDPDERCPGPAVTLIDEHFRPSARSYTLAGRLNPDTLNRHVAACHPCVVRLLMCARASGCDLAWAPLEGMVNILATQVVRRLASLGWPLDPYASETHSRTGEALDEARVKAYCVLWSEDQLAPANLAQLTDVPSYLRTSMTNRLRDWRRRELRRLGTWEDWGKGERIVSLSPRDPDEETSSDREPADPRYDPEGAALANDQEDTLAQLLATFREALGQRSGTKRVALFDVWLQAKRSHQPLTQAEMARQLKAGGVPISQPTVSRWIKAIQLELFVVLDEPDNGLSAQWRNAAIAYLLGEDGGPDDSDGEPTEVGPSVQSQPDDDDEAGYDHD